MLGCVPPSFMLLLMCFMPETPRFLLSQHKHQEAMAAMQFLWGYAQGWEEPPLGAQHQVRGWEPACGEGDPGESPLRSTQSGAAAPQVCAHTRTHEARGLGSDVLWTTAWPDPSLSPDLPVPGREGLGHVRGECRWGLEDLEF